MPSLTERAEQALLGALLREPHRFEQLPRLTPDDFSPGPHRHAFTVIKQNLESPYQASAGEIDPGLRAALKESCPDPDHVSAYARMVIEAGLRRHLVAHALRLEHAAGDLHHQARRLEQVASPGSTAEDMLQRALRTENGHLEPPVNRLLGHELLVSLALRAHAGAFDPGIETPLPSPPAEPGIGNGLDMISSSTVAVWHTAIQPTAPSRDEVTEREERVLASVIQGLPETSDLPAWLTADAFTDPARQEIFTAIVSLHARGEPVDELTTDWERARHQTPTPGAPRLDTSYAQRLARLPVRPTEVLTATGALLNHYENTRNAPLQLTETGPAVDGSAGPVPRRADPATSSPPLLQPPSGSSCTPGHQPRF